MRRSAAPERKQCFIDGRSDKLDFMAGTFYDRARRANSFGEIVADGIKSGAVTAGSIADPDLKGDARRR
jgi:hypothetical protein